MSQMNISVASDAHKILKPTCSLIIFSFLMICSNAYSGNLGNRVWHDTNSNGIQDTNEIGVPGATITIEECNSSTEIATTTSDEAGIFLFTNLPRAFYRLKFNIPSEYKFTLSEQGSVAWFDSDPDPLTGITPCTIVPETANILGFDAGLVYVDNSIPSGNGELGNDTWKDLNSNGVKDNNEPGLPGIDVTLFRCNDPSPIESTTSDSSGKFLFTELNDAYYQLLFSIPSGYELTQPEQGPIGWLDSDPDPSTGLTPCIRVRDTARIHGYDAGFVDVQQDPGPNESMNVLFITIDDLRPEIGAYDADEIQTPGLDELAQRGVVFNRAYSQVSTCSPSRTSLMTGMRPDTTQVRDLTTHFRDTIPNTKTLPQYFKENGYRTQGICKIYHGNLDDTPSWSEPSQQFFGNGTGNVTGPDGKPLPFVAIDRSDDDFGDYACASEAISAIEESKAENTPFFIAVGFRKPHLPFIAPKRFFDMYDKNAISEATNLFRAHDAPDFSFENARELQSYSGIPTSSDQFNEELRRDLKHAYYAATSFVDDQIKRLIDELDANDLSDNTIVVVLGDHGFHLGEQNDWGKHTNFETGVRVPLIIKAPGKSSNIKTDAIVELVDVYPSIVELAGLPLPTDDQLGGLSLEGNSFVEYIDNPTAPSTHGAFSQWARGGYEGVSIRTNRWRFTQWTNIFNGQEVYELYDHLLDPKETQNIAAFSEHASTISDLKEIIAAGGQTDLPLEYR